MWFIKIICVYSSSSSAATHSFCSFRCCFGFGFCSCFRSCSFPSLRVCACVLKHENVCSSSTWANKCSIYFFILFYAGDALLCWLCVLLFSLQFIRMLHFAASATVLNVCWRLFCCSFCWCYSLLWYFFLLLLFLRTERKINEFDVHIRRKGETRERSWSVCTVL